MSLLNTELARLFHLPASTATPVGQASGAAGPVRALVLEVTGPADWAELSPVWRGVQTDLDLPAPAIAVSGTDGIQLWFSLAEPVSLDHAAAFLAGLQGRYLGALPAKRVRSYPHTTSGDGAPALPPPVPALQAGTENWSAFVTQDLAAVFGEEPWLDLPPNRDQQAQLLGKLQSIKPATFLAALATLQAPALAPAPADANPAAAHVATVAEDTRHLSPREFLMHVMHDPRVAMADRIAAARALLPFTEHR
jgi:hypothetical protein